MDAVRDVAGDVGQVHQQGVVEVSVAAPFVADLGGDDALDAADSDESPVVSGS